MAFWARSFIFDGVPSEQFGLMSYDLDGHEQNDGSYGGKAKIIEDRLARQSSPIHYGIVRNDPLEFKITFGVEDYDSSFDRFDQEAVARWLDVGGQQYKWLSICQPDMEHVRYRCIITELKQITISGFTIAFEATVTCDGAYAYHIPTTDIIKCNGEVEYLLRNPCNIKDMKCMPKIILECHADSDSISIYNLSVSPDPFTLTSLSKYLPLTIEIDTASGIITSSKSAPLYELSNLEFPVLIAGDNKIKISGNVTAEIINEPLVNIGF